MQSDPVNILLADHDEGDRLLFVEAFKEIRMRTIVNTVKDDDELLLYLQAAGVITPHILFLGLNLPHNGGMECLKEIKSNHHLNDMAIVVYSTSASDTDIEDTFVKGANIYIRKPGDFKHLKRILSKVLKIHWQYQTSGLNRDIYMLNL